MLRLINGLIKPDTGNINIRGRIGGLIALGVGFNLTLTGRENIYVSSSIIGLRKEDADNLLPSIIDFAELHDFIDSPVQSYSSGMQARLGFAIAASITPDILLLDEVLAVGDRQFREKCYRRITELKNSGTGIILVAHSEPIMRMMCNMALHLRRGAQIGYGKVGSKLAAYSSESVTQQSISNHSAHLHKSLGNPTRPQHELPSISNLKIQSSANCQAGINGFTLETEIDYHHGPSIKSQALHLYISKDEIEVSHIIVPIDIMPDLSSRTSETSMLHVSYLNIQLAPGLYRMKAWLAQYTNSEQVQLPFSQTNEVFFELASNDQACNMPTIQFGIINTQAFLTIASLSENC